MSPNALLLLVRSVGLVTETNKLIVDWLGKSCTCTRASYNICLLHLTPLSYSLLIHSLTSVSGAYLQYGSARLSGPQPNVTLTVGVTNQKVYCGQDTGPVPTSIRWYNPQGLLVSSNNRDEVSQAAAAGGGRIVALTFRSYLQSQGGKYECRVNVSGNNSEMLSVCIGECHA